MVNDGSELTALDGKVDVKQHLEDHFTAVELVNSVQEYYVTHF